MTDRRNTKWHQRYLLPWQKVTDAKTGVSIRFLAMRRWNGKAYEYQAWSDAEMEDDLNLGIM